MNINQPTLQYIKKTACEACLSSLPPIKLVEKNILLLNTNRIYQYSEKIRLNFVKKSMASFNQTLYQIVFSTKYRNKTLIQNRPQIFKAMKTICKKYDCIAYAVDGVEDHVHLAISIPPTVTPCTLIQRLKIESNRFIKKNGICPSFEAWQRRYAIFTYHNDAKDRLVKYVINQEKHHRKKSFKTEIEELIKIHKIQTTQKDLDDFFNE